MNVYINSLIAVMIVCQIAVSVAPDSEHAVRYIRLVCALVVFLTILTPVRSLWNISDDLTEKITVFLSRDTSVTYEETETGAAALMQYVTEQYGISELSVILLTDESDQEITELRISVPDCPYATRAAIETDLNEQLNFPVFVIGE